jgi:hypothetical protein
MEATRSGYGEDTVGYRRSIDWVEYPPFNDGATMGSEEFPTRGEDQPLVTTFASGDGSIRNRIPLDIEKEPRNHPVEMVRGKELSGRAEG